MRTGAGMIVAIVVVTAAAACTSFDPYASQESQSSSLSGATTTVTSTVGVGGSGGAGGAGGAGVGGASPLDYCSMCALTKAYPVAQGAIDEASGIAASRAHEGVYYVNNDSGDLPRFFAVGGDGANDGVFSMSVTHTDYEDIAVGPCPEGHCVFVADIGDNDEVRPGYAIYRIAEPANLANAGMTPDIFPFVYADGPHNAEALLVHPITGEIAIVTKKKAGASQIFRAPDDWAPGQKATFTVVGEIAPPSGSPKITGASVHPQGLGVLIRTYTNLFYYAASAPDAPLGETLAHAPCPLPVADEVQGEAVSWTASGDGYLTIGEGPSPSITHAICHAK